ncbi:hypothetical protein CA850_29740 [Micromonospora echinospora]|uniref:Uncharacterized protein n=1 Tax=Micromonospora echinospora TaxID=1877 RepID=A0A1C5ABI1_MICEC|nr:hypothetical protein [Micromonospora echinospora]OZV74762.1 hypothetical protein CA850_29740 [Micromonospora echinospora]SCF42384.1 hypothetical protein GA0070618_6652 [Micromonospora echinospora]
MSVYTHGGDLAAYVIAAGEGDALLLGAGAELDVWNARTGGEQITDLTDADGVPLPKIVASDGTDGFEAGQIPPYKAPLPAVWLGEAGNPAASRVMSITVDTPDMITDALERAAAAQTAAVAAAAYAAELAASSSVSGHEQKADPHPQYATDARGDARWLVGKPAPHGPLSEPLWVHRLTSQPATSSADTAQWYVTHNGVEYLLWWWNERGYPRYEQKPGALYENLVVAIGAYNGTGYPILVERRESNGTTRTQVGGFDKDGRQLLSLHPWTALAAIDPNGLGRYTQSPSGETLGARWDANDTVRLRGRLRASSSTVSGDVMATLPAGFAPSHDRMLVVPVSNGAATAIEIMSTGAIVCRRANTGPPFDISLDDLTFTT